MRTYWRSSFNEGQMITPTLRETVGVNDPLSNLAVLLQQSPYNQIAVQEKLQIDQAALTIILEY